MDPFRVGRFWHELDKTGRVWAIALVGMTFQEPRLPVVGLAPAEVAALPLLALSAYWAARRRSWFWAPADSGVLGWGAGVLVAALTLAARLGWEAASGIGYEVSIALYLAAVYAAVRGTATPAALNAFPELFRGAAIVAGVFGLVGWGLALLGVANPLAFQLSHYLYIGSLPQAQGFLPSKNMLASLLGVALILQPRRPIFLLLALAASLSRSLLAIAAGGALAWAIAERRRRAQSLALATMLALVYVLVSHVALVWSPEERRALSRHVAGPPVVCLGSEGGAPCVFWTVYRYTKAASIEAIARTWPWGVGPGRQPMFEAQLQTEGLYPSEMPVYRPHCSYTGIPAEYGTAGLAGLVVFIAALFMTMGRLLGAANQERLFAARMTGALALIGIEALTTDVMHFRHLFWLVAVAGAMSARDGRHREAERRLFDR